ncbi:MAG: transposase, partial [Gammaproteobacteria bacterium]|nr:transposase [Gammaproteobacteria bacterium]
DTLKMFKQLSELKYGMRELSGILLLGQEELLLKLDDHQYWRAREFIWRCQVAQLAPITNDIAGCLAMKFARVNADVNTVFETDACDAMRNRLTVPLSRKSKKVNSIAHPLNINNLTVYAMNEAVCSGFRKVSGTFIQKMNLYKTK